MAKNKPIHDIRLGRVCAAIWENHSKNGHSWLTVTITRSYQDGDETKNTASFRRDDLPLVAKVADMAFAWIWDRRNPVPESDAHS